MTVLSFDYVGVDRPGQGLTVQSGTPTTEPPPLARPFAHFPGPALKGATLPWPLPFEASRRARSRRAEAALLDRSVINSLLPTPTEQGRSDSNAQPLVLET